MPVRDLTHVTLVSEDEGCLLMKVVDEICLLMKVACGDVFIGTHILIGTFFATFLLPHIEPINWVNFKGIINTCRGVSVWASKEFFLIPTAINLAEGGYFI